MCTCIDIPNCKMCNECKQRYNKGVTNMNDQALKLINESKASVTSKAAVMVQLTVDQKAFLEGLAETHETSVANLIRIALKTTYGIK